MTEARAWQRQLRSWEDVERELSRLERAERVELDGPWSIGTVLAHSAQSIECSVDGYPEHKPAAFKWTIGRMAIWTFLRKGSMSHDVTAPVPGLAEPPDDLSLQDGIARLRAAIHGFETHEGAYAPHLAFGPLSKAHYEQFHAMHLADHLKTLRVDSATQAHAVARR